MVALKKADYDEGLGLMGVAQEINIWAFISQNNDLDQLWIFPPFPPRKHFLP